MRGSIGQFARRLGDDQSRVRVTGIRRIAGFGLLALALLPAVGVVVGRAFGLPVGETALVESLMIPILLASGVWGGIGAASSSILAIAAVSPFASHVLFPHSASIGLWVWVAQAALYVGAAVTVNSIIGYRRVVDALVSPDLVDERSFFKGSDRVLSSLSNTVEIRDHHTQGHCERVARNAVVVGNALGISAEESNVLYWAARLHDLGKIAVPEYILLKSGRLTEEEFAEIRRHPAYGADLLASVSQSFRPIADVVRAHHERWDGLGYPLGYAGHEIPRLARVIAVVDVFEALTSERPYRSPMPESQALEYVKNGSGTQFDPELVRLFVGLYHRGEIECAGRLRRRVAAPQPVSELVAYPNA